MEFQLGLTITLEKLLLMNLSIAPNHSIMLFFSTDGRNVSTMLERRANAGSFKTLGENHGDMEDTENSGSLTLSRTHKELVESTWLSLTLPGTEPPQSRITKPSALNHDD